MLRQNIIYFDKFLDIVAENGYTNFTSWMSHYSICNIGFAASFSFSGLF